MLRALVFLLKVAVFSIVVLVIGNTVRFGGRTISDQVRAHLASAERPQGVIGKVKGWAGEITEDARQGIKQNLKGAEPRRVEEHPRASAPAKHLRTDPDHLTASERQKLRALIQNPDQSKSD